MAGRLTVTVYHGGGVRTSYSYLSTMNVDRGRVVGAGEVVGASGSDHGLEAVSFVAAGGGGLCRPDALARVSAGAPRGGRASRSLPCRPMPPPCTRHPGGTFDPPHLAHLVAGEAASHELGLDVVTFLPAGRPWQKADLGVSPAAHRWEMTRRAVAGVAY